MFRGLSKFSLFVILSVWSLLPHCVTPVPSAVTVQPARQSFLWEAKRGQQTLTLVGTMHIGIGPKDMDPKLWARLKDADTVIVETDMTHQDPALMQSFMTAPKDYDLSKQLGAKHWRHLSEILANGGSAMSEEQLKPLSLLAAGALLLQLQAKEDQAIAEGQLAIDQIIFERSQAMGKKTLTFETNREQLGFLKAVFTVEALQKMIDEWDAESGEYAHMKETFKNGDSKALDDLLEEVPKEIRAVLLDERNQNWRQSLPKLAGKQRTLIAVGAAHFAGPKGLLKLLEQDGYVIRPL